MSTKEQILDILAEYVDIPAGGPDFDEPFKQSGEINSFVFLSMISAVEERFGVSIPGSLAAEFKTLNQLIAYIDGCGEKVR